MNKLSAHDILAFGIVELNVSLPYDVLCEMSPNSQLYQALLKAWKEKERRLDSRTALLCVVTANVQGNHMKQSDFMPQDLIKTTEEAEQEIKSNFIKYNSIVEANK